MMIVLNVSSLSSGIEMIRAQNSSLSVQTPAPGWEEKKQNGGLVWGRTTALIIAL